METDVMVLGYRVIGTPRPKADARAKCTGQTKIVGATMRSHLVMILAAIGLVNCAAAQANPDSIKVRNNCRLAAKTIASGNPAPHQEWAYGYIGNCPVELGAAVASGMRANRTATDTALLNHLTYATRYIHDAAVLDAAMEIAADQGASFEARIFSLRSLLWMTERIPSPIGFGSLARGDSYPDSKRCPISTMTDVEVVQGGNPLPPNYRSQIQQMAARLESDTSESGDIRGIAWCLQR